MRRLSLIRGKRDESTQETNRENVQFDDDIDGLEKGKFSGIPTASH